MVECTKCHRNAVIKYATDPKLLCATHFNKIFEKRVFHTIRKYELLKKGERVGVACSGGKDSTTVLHLVNKLAKSRNDAPPIAIAVNEGIHGYRDKTIEDLREFCEENEIELHVTSYEEEFGKKLDDFVKVSKEKNLNVKPCGICGNLRRTALNRKARELGVDKLVTGHNLDDEGQTFIINLLRGDVQRSARMGPVTGVSDLDGFVTRVKPLYFCTEREIATYALLKKFPLTHVDCPNSLEAYRQDVRNAIEGLEAKYPGTKKALIKTSLQYIELSQNASSKKELPELRACKDCGEPCSSETCKTCDLLGLLHV